MRVLLVDDDPLVLRALGLLLESELDSEADVIMRESVGEALELLNQDGSFDVVVADLRMPDRWGDELLAYVHARSPSTRRLLLTGDRDPDRTVRELMERGVVEACFRKPRADGLVEAIRSAPVSEKAPPGPTRE